MMCSCLMFPWSITRGTEKKFDVVVLASQLSRHLVLSKLYPVINVLTVMGTIRVVYVHYFSMCVYVLRERERERERDPFIVYQVLLPIDPINRSSDYNCSLSPLVEYETFQACLIVNNNVLTISYGCDGIINIVVMPPKWSNPS
mgnify:CR=1 FL=1